MSNATKTLLALFVILLVITGLVKWTGNSNTSSGLRNAVVKFDTAKVNKITIENGKTGDVVLNKVNKMWKVKSATGTKVYKADRQQVANALEQVNNIMPTSIVTRDKNKFRRYEVDSTGTRVQINDGNKNLSDFYIGRFQYSGPGQMTTYVRPSGQNNVYAVNGYLSDSFTKKLNKWRNRKIWTIKKANISKIDMIYPADSSFSAEPVKKGQWVSGKDTLDMGIFTSVLDHFLNFSAYDYENGMTPSEFGKPLYEIKIHLTNGVVKDLKFKPDTKDKKSYIGITNGYPYVFTENKKLFDEEVFRSRKYLLKKTHVHMNKKLKMKH